MPEGLIVRVLHRGTAYEVAAMYAADQEIYAPVRYAYSHGQQRCDVMRYSLRHLAWVDSAPIPAPVRERVAQAAIPYIDHMLRRAS